MRPNSTGWASATRAPTGCGIDYIDHLTNNVFRGAMDRWYQFYQNLFNFRQIRYFDIAGKMTGLYFARADQPLRKDPNSLERIRRRQKSDRGISAPI